MRCNGTYGEDGAVQGLLACLGIPFTVGRCPRQRALRMDKGDGQADLSRPAAFQPTARDRCNQQRAEAAEIGVPCVVKPGADG